MANIGKRVEFKTVAELIDKISEMEKDASVRTLSDKTNVINTFLLMISQAEKIRDQWVPKKIVLGMINGGSRNIENSILEEDTKTSYLRHYQGSFYISREECFLQSNKEEGDGCNGSVALISGDWAEGDNSRPLWVIVNDKVTLLDKELYEV